MVYLTLLALSVAALGFGASLSALLSCKIRSIPLFASTAAISLLAASLATLQLSPTEMLPGLLAAIAAGTSGYALATWWLLRMDRPRELPRLDAERASNPGHLAVVYFTHGESEEYDQLGWVHQFREFDHQGLSFIPFLARPFFFSMLRRNYMRAGRSKHRHIHSRMMDKVKESLARTGPEEARLYLSFLDDEPRPDVAAAKAFNEGASTIVVCNVFLTDSNHTAEGAHLVKALGLEEKGVRVLYTRPLWDSALLRRSFLEKANAVVKPEERPDTGVLLVGHGQPEEWDREFATETEQEIKFRQAVLREFEENGYRKENVRLAWMAFREPNATEVAREMVAKGLRRLVYFSAAISAESIHSQRDIPDLVAKAKVPGGVEIIDLGAWNDHPLVIQAITERVGEALRKAG